MAIPIAALAKAAASEGVVEAVTKVAASAPQESAVDPAPVEVGPWESSVIEVDGRPVLSSVRWFRTAKGEIGIELRLDPVESPAEERAVQAPEAPTASEQEPAAEDRAKEAPQRHFSEPTGQEEVTFESEVKRIDWETRAGLSDPVGQNITDQAQKELDDTIEGVKQLPEAAKRAVEDPEAFLEALPDAVYQGVVEGPIAMGVGVGAAVHPQGNEEQAARALTKGGINYLTLLLSLTGIGAVGMLGRIAKKLPDVPTPPRGGKPKGPTPPTTPQSPKRPSPQRASKLSPERQALVHPKEIEWTPRERKRLKGLIEKARPDNPKWRQRGRAFEKLVRRAQKKRYGRRIYREISTGDTRLDAGARGLVTEAKSYVAKKLNSLSSGSRSIQLWRQAEVSLSNKSVYELVVVDRKLVGKNIVEELRNLEDLGLEWRISEFDPVQGKMEILHQSKSLDP